MTRSAAVDLVPLDSSLRAAEWMPVPHPRPFVCSFRITASDLSGTIEHVSNVRHIGWLDRAAELHADSLGWTRRRLLDEGCMWFVARHEIDYLAEAHLHDELLIATWVRDMGRVKSWREYVIGRPADRTIIVRAATLWVLVNLASRRPLRIPAAMAGAFEPLVAAPVAARGGGR